MIGSGAQQPREDFVRWTTSAIVAIAMHGGIAAAFLVHLAAKPVALPPSAAMMIDLAPVPTSTAPTPSPTPPGPEQVQAQVQPLPQLEPVKMPKFTPPPVLKVKLAVTLPKLELDRPDRKQEPDEKPADASTASPTAIALKADAVAAPTPGASSATPTTAEETWEDQILARLQHEKRYPGEAERHGFEDVVYLKFKMDRLGHVLSCAIKQSHGYAALDEEVLNLIHRVEPLPLPPEQVKGQEIELVVPVDFFIRHRG